MSRPRAAKKPKPKTNGDLEHARTISLRMPIQESSWLEELTQVHQREHGLKANQSEIIRMLIRKAAKAAGLTGA